MATQPALERPLPQNLEAERSVLGAILVDNHAINTVPKETLVKITKAEAGGPNGQGAWAPGTTGMSPGSEDELMKRYLGGNFSKIRKA